MITVSITIYFYFRGPYDAERDWPEPDDCNNDEIDGNDEDFIQDSNANAQAEDKLTNRRGSSEETKFRRRKRFETYHEFENWDKKYCDKNVI